MKLQDLARKLTPKGLHEPLRRALFSKIPIEFRMGKEYWETSRFLESAQWWHKLKIEEWQLSKLQQLVKHAYDNVPGYYQLYKEANIKPNDIRELKDIKNIPYTTKELLKENLEEFTSKLIPKYRLSYATTGGSTGIPFGFYQTKDADWKELAFMHSGWKRTGWKLGDSCAILRGNFVGSEKRISKTVPYNKELHLSSYHLSADTYPRYAKELEQAHPKHLAAYPSAASILADLICSKGDQGRFNFNAVFLGSENIFEWQIKKIQYAFPKAHLFGWYGHSERAILAQWSEDDQRYHDCPFYGITELIPTTKHDKSIGELVGTSLINLATPFIRYRTADLAIADERLPNERRSYQIFKEIVGREQNSLVAPKGRIVPIPTTSMHDDTLDNVAQFQFYQETPGEVVFRIIKGAEYSDKDSQNIKRELAKKLGQDMALRLEFVSEIKKSPSGKHLFVEQRLSI